MKELSIKQKAKAYDKAIEKARRLLSYCINDRDRRTKIYSVEDIESIFHEFKESKDEKIRKAIHIYLDWLDGRKDYQPKGDYTIRDMIDWVIKQGQVKESAISQQKDKTCKKNCNFLTRKLDSDKVIEWLKTHGNLVPIVTIKINEVIDKFKKDFEL